MSHVDSIFGGPQKKIVPTEPTIRLEVELEKTSKDSFPEFSYLSLKKELNSNRETAEKENKDTTNLGNPESQNLADYFEKKYGNFGNTAKFDKKKRRRHERIEDFIDMGEGYDAEDEFIDDADAQDIFVPQD